MKISSAAFALFIAILPAALAANPEDLYTRVGTDPTPAELLANGTIVPGETSSTRTVLGSQIIVNHALLEQQTGVLGAFSSLSGVHIPTGGGRNDYANITRWYQNDGNTQIFRLFQGENNYRYPILAEAPPSRVEAISHTLTVDPALIACGRAPTRSSIRYPPTSSNCFRSVRTFGIFISTCPTMAPSLSTDAIPYRAYASLFVNLKPNR